MRPLQKYLSVFFLSLFIGVSLIASPVVQAIDIFPDFGAKQPKTPQDYAKEFCDKRSGDLMNLETWFSGKCGPDIDPLSGEGVGFVDIITLQGLEFLFSPQYKSYQETIKDSIDVLKSLRDQISNGEITPAQVDLAQVEGGGIISPLARLTTGLITTKPATTADYIAYISNNLKNHNIVKDTWAAGPGYGFTALSPILPLWRAFRNVSYLIFALAFVLYGIMIMFRVRIDAKTAASIQLAIPKLVFTLIIITFSYAIVGLLIDISTVITALLISVLRAGGILNEGISFLPAVASGTTIFGGLGSFFLNFVIAMIISPFIFFNLVIGGFFGLVASVLVGALSMASGLGILFAAFLFMAIGYSYFKLILKLFQSYLSIIVSLIFSPLILLGSLLPGSDSFGSWLRSIYGNLAVFPVACFFLVLSYALMVQPILALSSVLPFLGEATEFLFGVNNLSSGVFGGGQMWAPPLTLPGGNITEGGGTIGVFKPIGHLMLATIGIGLLLMASKYVEMVEKALKTPPFPYGAAIGEALKYGAGTTSRIPPQYIPRAPGAIPTWITQKGLAVAGSVGGAKGQNAPTPTAPTPPAPIS